LLPFGFTSAAARIGAKVSLLTSWARVMMYSQGDIPPVVGDDAT
jgi:hypothetical protein